MYLRTTSSPLAPAQVVESRIVWISKRTVLNNFTWVGGWGEEEAEEEDVKIKGKLKQRFSFPVSLL